MRRVEFDEALQALEEKVATNPDFIYKTVSYGTCHYLPTDRYNDNGYIDNRSLCGCLIGEVLTGTFEVSPEVLDVSLPADDLLYDLAYNGIIEFSLPAVKLYTVAQVVQDRGYTWQEALNAVTTVDLNDNLFVIRKLLSNNYPQSWAE